MDDILVPASAVSEDAYGPKAPTTTSHHDDSSSSSTSGGGAISGLNDEQKDQLRNALKKGGENAVICGKSVPGNKTFGEGEAQVTFDGATGHVSEVTLSAPFAGSEIEKCMKAEMNWANFRFYRNFGGAMFRMTNSGFTTTVMTVDDPAGLRGVSQGDVLKLSADDGRSGAVRAGSLTVASVQHPVPGGNGSVTLTGNIVARRTFPAPASYCNAAPSGLGCTGTIGFAGNASATAGEGFVIDCDGVRNRQSGVLFFGLEGRATIPFNDGTLCVRPPLKRVPLQNSGGASASTQDCSGSFAFEEAR